MTRQPEVILVVGRNGVGKTTLAKKLVSKFDESALLVVSPTGEWGAWEAERSERGKLVAGPHRLVTGALANGAEVVVLDDCDAYLRGQTSEFWRRLLSTNRHLGVDVLLLSRRPQELPHWAVAAATRAYVFALGPREAAWARRMFGVDPPTEAHSVRAISL